MKNSSDIGIYFHWPFCLAKCPYCDFNVHIQDSVDHSAWREAYTKVIRHYAAMVPGRRVVSVFFGGGTPSLMDPSTIEGVLNEIRAHWPVAPKMEVTMEANPTSVETQKFKSFKMAGINRVSLGVQALNDADLKFLGRQHDAAQARAAIDVAGSLFDRFSFDLIYARPGQTLDQWRKELEYALTLARGHISLYQLTIERTTPFYFDLAQGKFSMPEEGLAADFYLMTQEIMERDGYPAYEVSNHAMPGHESAHNLVYWRYGDYIGIGPGAHGRLTVDDQKFATRDHAAPEIWLRRVAEQEHAYHPFAALSARDRFVEALMMGLRLHEGVPVKKLEAEGQCSFDHIIDLKKMEIAIAEGWISYDQSRLSLSREGMMRLNAMIPFLMK